MTRPAPLAYSVADLAAAVGVSESLVRRCIRATEPINGWQPLPAKRLPDGQLRITRADAEAWVSTWKAA